MQCLKYVSGLHVSHCFYLKLTSSLNVSSFFFMLSVKNHWFEILEISQVKTNKKNHDTVGTATLNENIIERGGNEHK